MSIDERDYMRDRNKVKNDYIYNPKEFRAKRPISSEPFLEKSRKNGGATGILPSILVWVIIAFVLFKLFQYLESSKINKLNLSIIALPSVTNIKQQFPENGSTVQFQKAFSPHTETPQVTRSISNITGPIPEKELNRQINNLAGIYKCVNSGHVTYGSVPCTSGAAVYQSDLVIVTHAPMTRSVALRRGGNGVYNLSGNVNGFPVDFILDTGAAKTTISGTTAYQMGIHTCQVTNNSSTANGLAGNCSMLVSKLSVGDFVFSNVTVNIAPNMQGNSLIGNDLLSELKVEQHNGEMTLSK